jgi:hypothetical protein
MGDKLNHQKSGKTTAFGAVLIAISADHLGLVGAASPRTEVYAQHEDVDQFGVGGCGFPIHIHEEMHHGK